MHEDVSTTRLAQCSAAKCTRRHNRGNAHNAREVPDGLCTPLRLALYAIL